MKKIKYIFWSVLSLLFVKLNALATTPEINCTWLPWCSNTSDKPVFNFISTLISEGIKYVAVFSVIAIMIAWIFYIVSVWDDEKTKKAKNWILWSLVWVLLSISAWSIINLLNLFRIN